MKRTIFTFGLVVAVLAALFHSDVVLSLKQWLEAPRRHTVQPGESLSRIAQANYGQADYWRELALVNRVPRPEHLQTGEEILLPDAGTIAALRRARTLTRVNDLVRMQEVNVAAISSGPAAAAPPASVPPASAQPAGIEPQAAQAEAGSDQAVLAGSTAASGSWFWLVLGVIAFGSVAGFVLYRRRLEAEGELDEEEISTPGEHTRNFTQDRRPLRPRNAEGLRV